MTEETQNIKQKEKKPFFTENKTLPSPNVSRIRKKRGLWVIIGLLMVFLCLLGGAYLGYTKGIQLRIAQSESQITLQAATQYQLGLEDLAEGRYEMARKRFEYVIQLDPNFPGVVEKLSEVMLVMSVTDEPTKEMVIIPTATPAYTPTPDLRGQDEIFAAAHEYLRNRDWDMTIETLNTLRKVDQTFRIVEVDGMFYMALRNRGVDKILNQGNLEGGIYDLALAERFGPLDIEAKNYRTWARYYLTGASFWEVDWAQVVNYFSQFYTALPNLRDGSNITATERYRLALIGYGDQLAKEEKWCDAAAQYQEALKLLQDESLKQTADQAAQNCLEMEPEEPSEEPTAEP